MRAIHFSFYHVLIFICIFQGLLLASIFLFNKKFRKKSSMALAIGLIALSLAGVGEIIQDLELKHAYSFLRYIPITHFSVICFGFYYFVIYLLNPQYQLSKIDYWIFLPFIFLFLSKLVLYTIQLIDPIIIKNHPTPFFILNILANYIPVFYSLILFALAYKKVNQYHTNLFDNFSETEGKELYWLRNLLMFSWFTCLFWLLVTTQIFLQDKRTATLYFIWIILCFITYWLGYLVILKRDVFKLPTFKKTETTKTELSDKTAEHYQNLLQLIETEKLYLDAQLSMDILSEKLDLSNGYLSKIINQKEGKNFYDFINAYRVSEVKANLINPDYSHYSILGIGLEAGFKSKSTFNAVFKKMTGMTPSNYKKTLK